MSGWKFKILMSIMVKGHYCVRIMNKVQDVSQLGFALLFYQKS